MLFGQFSLWQIHFNILRNKKYISISMRKNISFSFSLYWTKTVSKLFDDNFILETYFIYCFHVGIKLYWMSHEYWKHKKYFIKINSSKSNYIYIHDIQTHICIIFAENNLQYMHITHFMLCAYLKQDDFNFFKSLFVHIITILCPVKKLWISDLYWWMMIYNYKHLF